MLNLSSKTTYSLPPSFLLPPPLPPRPLVTALAAVPSASVSRGLENSGAALMDGMTLMFFPEELVVVAAQEVVAVVVVVIYLAVGLGETMRLKSSARQTPTFWKWSFVLTRLW